MRRICRRWKIIGDIGAIRIIGIKNTTPKRTFKAGSATPSKKRATHSESLKRVLSKKLFMIEGILCEARR